MERRTRTLLVAILAIAPFSPGGVAQPQGTPPQADPNVLVHAETVSVQPGIPLRVGIEIHHRGDEPLTLIPGAFRADVYYTGGGRDATPTPSRPVLSTHREGHGGEPVTLQPGERVLVARPHVLWNGSLVGLGDAPDGNYRLDVAVPLPGGRFAMGSLGFSMASERAPPAARFQAWANETLGSTDSGPETAAIIGGGPSTSTDTSAGYNLRAGRGWGSLPLQWAYNPTSEPAFSPTTASAAIAAGFDQWQNDGASYTTHSRTADRTDRTPWNDDDENMVGWCVSPCMPRGWVGGAQTWISGSTITECDVYYNATAGFSTSGAAGAHDVQAVTVHEVGHCLGMGHLMNPGECDGSNLCYEAWMGNDNQGQAMYYASTQGDISKRTLSWGDASAIRYHHPFSNTAASSIGDSTAEADSALYDVDGNGVKDLVVAWIDNPSGDNTVHYKIGWSVGTNGIPSSWTATKTAFSGVGHATPGLGIAIGDLDVSGRPELLVFWVDDPSGDNTAYYKVGWALTTAGDVSTWSSRKTVGGGGLGSSTTGAGACVTRLDGTSAPELVFAYVDDPSGANTIYYRIGWNVNSAGDAGWTGSTAAGGQIGWATPGLGVACGSINPDPRPEIFFGWADDPTGSNGFYYRVGYDFQSTGAASSWLGTKSKPGGGIGDSSEGAGLALGDLQNTWYDFDLGADGFSKHNDQSGSDVSWSMYGGALSLTGDRTAFSDESFRRTMPVTLDQARSFTVHGQWTVTSQGNWQGAIPLYLHSGDTVDVANQARMLIYYSSRDSYQGQNPIYYLQYRDAGGVVRFNEPVSASRTGTFEFAMDYNAATRGLTMLIRDVGTGTTTTRSYTLAAGDTFSLSRIGVATDGTASGWEPPIAATADNLRLHTASAGGGPELVLAYVDNPVGGNSLHYRQEWNTRVDAHN